MGSLVGILAGIGLLVAMNLDYALARYPGSQYVGDKQFDLLYVHDGYAGEVSLYRTGDDVATVWDWYRSYLGFQPQNAGGLNTRTGCVTLGQTRQRAWVRRAITVTLCPTSHGTSLYISQALDLGE